MILFHLPVIPFYVWKDSRAGALDKIKYTLIGVVLLPITVTLSLTGGLMLLILNIRKSIKTHNAKKEAKKFQEISFPIIIGADKSIEIPIIKSKYNRRDIEFKITDGQNTYLISK